MKLFLLKITLPELISKYDKKGDVFKITLWDRNHGDSQRGFSMHPKPRQLPAPLYSVQIYGTVTVETD